MVAIFDSVHLQEFDVSTESMVNLTRRPLSTRQQELSFGLSPQKLPTRSVKRPRSPDTPGHVALTPTHSKRVKSVSAEPTTFAATNDEERRDKDHRRLAREAAKNEFRIKYTRAFPSFVFYFDLDQLDLQSATLRTSLVARAVQLGAVCWLSFRSHRLSFTLNSALMTSSPTK